MKLTCRTHRSARWHSGARGSAVKECFRSRHRTVTLIEEIGAATGTKTAGARARAYHVPIDMGRSSRPNSQDVMLYRDMAPEGNSPLVGPYNFALGVRTDEPPIDISVRDGYVEPAPDGARGRGMSVAPDEPRNLTQRHRPPELDGTGAYPIWCISRRDLGSRLRYRATSPTHGVIEPAYRMTLDDYEEALEGTRRYWTRVIG